MNMRRQNNNTGYLTTQGTFFRNIQLEPRNRNTPRYIQRMDRYMEEFMTGQLTRYTVHNAEVTVEIYHTIRNNQAISHFILSVLILAILIILFFNIWYLFKHLMLY